MIRPISLFICAVCLWTANGSATDKTFVLRNASRDLDEFRAFAKMASQLKPYGEVQIDIGVLADKSRYEMPKGGSAWHEYAVKASCMAKFFPHPKIAPFIPADWVAKNRQLPTVNVDGARVYHRPVQGEIIITRPAPILRPLQ